MIMFLIFSMLLLTTPYAAAAEQDDFDPDNNALIALLNSEDELPTRGDEIPLPKIACISLGERCSAALNFRRAGLSRAYYPFDFIATPFKGLCMLLQNKFENFLQKSALVITKNNDAWFDENKEDRPETAKAAKSQKMVLVTNKLTGCDFVHDFKNKQLANYPLVAEKYQRRIDRFYKTIEQAEEIFFFRTHLNKKDATTLHLLLRSLFPEKRFTLVVPTDPEHMKQPWGLPGVKEFLMYNQASKKYQRHGNSAHWDKIFCALHLA